MNNKEFFFQNADLSVTYNFWSLFGSSKKEYSIIMVQTNSILVIHIMNIHRRNNYIQIIIN